MLLIEHITQCESTRGDRTSLLAESILVLFVPVFFWGIYCNWHLFSSVTVPSAGVNGKKYWIRLVGTTIYIPNHVCISLSWKHKYLCSTGREDRVTDISDTFVPLK